MAYDEEYDVAKFNVILELPRGGDQDPLRVLCALSYLPDNKQLRLITLF